MTTAIHLGATVRVKVSPTAVGKFLRAMEHRADLHILDRTFDKWRNTFEYAVRGEFPSDWDRREVLPIFNGNAVSFESLGQVQ